MPGSFNLDAYFGRIRYTGSTRPDLSALRALHGCHASAIPFENLEPFCGRGVALDLPSLQSKLIDRRRGGYCFEQNTLFSAALKKLDFKVTGLAARVRWKARAGRPPGPREHMLLRIDLAEGPYLVDVGFGPNLLDTPLMLQADVEQVTPSASYRLTNRDGSFELSTHLDGEWQAMYVLGQEPQEPADYEMANWYTSHHPDLWSTRSLLVQRLIGNERYTLINTRFSVRRRSEVMIDRELADGAELVAVLDQMFNLEAPVAAENLYAKLVASQLRAAIKKAHKQVQ